jgi:hypothetical protein
LIERGGRWSVERRHGVGLQSKGRLRGWFKSNLASAALPILSMTIFSSLAAQACRRESTNRVAAKEVHPSVKRVG